MHSATQLAIDCSSPPQLDSLRQFGRTITSPGSVVMSSSSSVATCPTRSPLSNCPIESGRRSAVDFESESSTSSSPSVSVSRCPTLTRSACRTSRRPRRWSVTPTRQCTKQSEQVEDARCCSRHRCGPRRVNAPNWRLRSPRPSHAPNSPSNTSPCSPP